MTTTDFRKIVRAMRAGAAALGRRTDLLDRINVFPVMDGDTGTNMTVTLASLPNPDLETLPTTGEMTADLLLAASGNSGIILAEYIVGLLTSLKEKNVITPVEFAAAARDGRDRAYRAVLVPKEGTMLTVMTDLADALFARAESFEAQEHSALCSCLRVSVAKTKDTLEKLRDARVVDAGALGFYLFAAGLTLAAVPNSEDEISSMARGASEPSLEGLEVSAPVRGAVNDLREEKHYCINLLIRLHRDVDPTAAFEGLGDSANLAREGDLLKLHLHADDAAVLKARARTVGEIIDVKIQDIHAAMRTRVTDIVAPTVVPKGIRVVTDSGVSLDRNLAARLGILRVDNRVLLFDEKVPDREVNLDELFAAMRRGKSFKTAQVTPEEAGVFLRDALLVSDHVVYIGVGNAYTGTQNSMRTAARSLDAERFTLLDSRAASGQLGLICLAVQRFADTGAELSAVLAYAARQIETCKEYLVIDDLDYLVRSGRIGKIKAGFASLLSLKPIVGHGGDGAVTYAKVRSIEAAEREILARIQSHPGEGAMLILVEYTDNKDYAERLRERFAAHLPKDTEVLLSPLSSASAVHMGPGTFGAAVTRTAP